MKETIIKTFINLINSMNYEDITVKLICKKCYISRTTFYKYFKNTEDVLLEIENKVLDDMDDIYKEYNYQDILTIDHNVPAPNFYEMYKYIYNHKEIFKFIYSDKCPKPYYNKTMISINNKLTLLFSKYLDEIQTKEAVSICSNFIMSTGKALVSEKTTLTPKQLSIMIKNVIQALIKDKEIYFNKKDI